VQAKQGPYACPGPVRSWRLAERISKVVDPYWIGSAAWKFLEIASHEIPTTESFSMLAATLYFHENDFDNVLKTLDRPLTISQAKQNRSNFMIAESYYQMQQTEIADSYFKKIENNSAHYDQALYRMAEYQQINENEDAALKLYKELAETGKNPLWIGLAVKAIEYATLFN
jgi:tetratricopeptide (TPR) repeat protein